MGVTSGVPVHPAAPSSRTSWALLSLTILQSSGSGEGGNTPGAGGCLRGLPGLGRPLSAPARLQTTV